MMVMKEIQLKLMVVRVHLNNVNIMSIFCKNNYKIVQEITTQSKAELQNNIIGCVSTPITSSSHNELYKRKHITIFNVKNVEN